MLKIIHIKRPHSFHIVDERGEIVERFYTLDRAIESVRSICKYLGNDVMFSYIEEEGDK